MPITRPMSVLDPERFDLSRLSAAETLWLWRHRQSSGQSLGASRGAISQAVAADRLGIAPSAYMNLEHGRSTNLSAQEVRTLLAALGPIDPKPRELCALARRRSGMSLTTVHEAMNLGRVWYMNLEAVGDARVVSYWEGQGFRFPVAQKSEAA